MSERKMQMIEEQIARLGIRLANADKYVARNVNVESVSFLHFADWKGQSGHPSWMRNHMIPATKKACNRKAKALARIEHDAKEKELSRRKRRSKTEMTECVVPPSISESLD